MDSNVIAIDIVGRMLFDCRIELEADAILQFGLKALSGPSVTEEEKLEAGTLAMFAQNIGVAEEFGNSFDDRNNLIPSDKRIQSRAKIRLGRETAGNSQRESDLGLAAHNASNGGEADVVDLGIGAPDAASGDGDFELARQVVELGIACQQPRSFQHERRSVDDFVCVNARDGASSHIAYNVTASAGCIQADLPEAVEDFGQRFYSDPVELNILAYGEIGDSVGVLASEVGDDAELRRGQDAVGNSDAHHEALQRLPYSAGSASYACAVALGVNAPPAEIGTDPFGRDRLKSLAGEAPNFVEAVPGVGRALQALDSLRCRLFGWLRHKCYVCNKKPTARVRLAVG